MIPLTSCEGQNYPAFQASGFAARFAFPYAQEVCKGVGYDIGCGRPEWAFPGAIPVDPALGTEYDARHLPIAYVDYIFSSHTLEHLDDWFGAIKFWTSRIKPEGTLFLYLPHYDQRYWRPWNNRSHKNILTPEIVKDALVALDYRSIFVSGRDLNHSFMVMGEKSYKALGEKNGVGLSL